MDQHAATGGTDDGSDQFPRAQKTILHSKRPHHTKKDFMKIAFGVDWRTEVLLWCGKRGLMDGTPL